MRSVNHVARPSEPATSGDGTEAEAVEGDFPADRLNTAHLGLRSPRSRTVSTGPSISDGPKEFFLTGDELRA